MPRKPKHNPKGYVAKRKFPKKSAKVGKSFRKKVQKVIDENCEDKQAYKQVSDVNYNSGINNSTDTNFLFPNITTSTADNGRIGDQIKLKRFRIQGHIISNLTFNDYNSCRLGVRVIICQPKNYGSVTLITNGAATWMAHLLKKGGSTSGFTGIVSDLYSPINTDAITCYFDKLLYMTAPYVAGTDTGNKMLTQSITTFFDIKLKCKNKKIVYDAAIDSGLTPAEYNPVLLLGYAHLTNSTPDTVDTQLNLSWVSTVDYQDA